MSLVCESALSSKAGFGALLSSIIYHPAQFSQLVYVDLVSTLSIFLQISIRYTANYIPAMAGYPLVDKAPNTADISAKNAAIRWLAS